MRNVIYLWGYLYFYNVKNFNVLIFLNMSLFVFLKDNLLENERVFKFFDFKLV